jgi:hypothetical protein
MAPRWNGLVKLLADFGDRPGLSGIGNPMPSSPPSSNASKRGSWWSDRDVSIRCLWQEGRSNPKG